MLLLGVALHLAVPYSGIPAQGFFANEQHSGIIALLIVIVHHFRMPVFFVLAGFFSAHVYTRRGWHGFVRTRLRQIGVVWLVSLAVLYPVVALTGIYNHFAATGESAWSETVRAVESGDWERSWLLAGPIHLWFLEYLLLFCGVAAVTVRVSGLHVLDDWTGRALRSGMRAVVFAVPTMGSLTFLPLAFVPYPDSFTPSVTIVFVYGWPFAAGWFLYRRRDLLPAMARRSRLEPWIAIGALTAAAAAARHRTMLGLGVPAPAADLAIGIFTAIFIWATVFALVTKAASAQERPWIRYVADASYWMYLTHLPLALVMPALMRSWSVPPVVKIAAGWLVTVPLLLLAYQLVVRHTFVGRVLRGRPAFGAASAPAAAWTAETATAPASDR